MPAATRSAGSLLALLLLVSLVAVGCRRSAAAEGIAEPPPPLREMRGAWVASVSNIDWPSKPGLPAARQRAEAIAILDRAAALNLNTIILQVRPAADALYPSDLEPWSFYLTGAQGRPPEPSYDPLAFWIAEAHARGIELHAWINPFRVRPAGKPFELSEESVGVRHPRLVKSYGAPGTEQLWMDPGEPAARARTLAVVRDLVRRYDLDGVHIDDYFYPYPTAGIDFPDDRSYARYRRDGGKLARDDFRRAQIDTLVREMYRAIKREKPHVKFGISPFGIWRPGHPAGIAGLDQYAALYADARKWLREGWCDYWTPQLYWPIARRAQSFPLLLAWWAKQNPRGRTLAPGLFTSRVLPTEQDWPADEIAGQILVTRGHALFADAPGGHVHFSMKALTLNAKGLADALRDGVYRERALPPAMPWIDRRPPRAPRVRVAGPARPLVNPVAPGRPDPHVRPPATGAADPPTRATPPPLPGLPSDRYRALRAPEPPAGAEPLLLRIDPRGRRSRWWAVQVLTDAGWTLAAVRDGDSRALELLLDVRPRAVAVRAIDAAGNESRATVTRLP